MGYLNPVQGSKRQPRTVAGAPTNGTDEVQTLTFGGTITGGTFELGFKGQRTGPIEWSATTNTLVANIDAALEALNTIRTGNVTTADSTLSSGVGDVTVTFVSALGKLAVPLLTVDGALLEGTAPTLEVAETTPGVTATARGSPTGTEIIRTSNGVKYVNTGTATAPTWTQQTTPSAEMAAMEAAIPTAAVADLAALTATAIAAAVPAAAPAGGTGAAAGGWDTAQHRDDAITTINDLRTHAIELDLDYEAMLVDVGLIRTKLNDLLAKLRTAGIVTP